MAGADTLLGPEMRSTGEVMGIDMSYPQAYAKAALAAGQKLPTGGKVFLTVMDKHKDAIVPIAQQLQVSPATPHPPPCLLQALLCCRACTRTGQRCNASSSNIAWHALWRAAFRQQCGALNGCSELRLQPGV